MFLSNRMAIDQKGYVDLQVEKGGQIMAKWTRTASHLGEKKSDTFPILHESDSGSAPRSTTCIQMTEEWFMKLHLHWTL